MKKDDDEDLKPEYDFASMSGGVRGKYAASYRGGTNLVRLDPDVAHVFATDKAVNDALRSLMRGGKESVPSGSAS